VIEDRCFRSARGLAVVVAGDRVQQLGENSRLEAPGLLLDHPHPEMDVPEQPSLLPLRKRRAGLELPDATHVVQQRRRQEKVGAQAWVELSGLAAERRHPDGVLEQPTRVAVVPVRAGRGQGAEPAPDLGVTQE
jgi:hypothetical protein